jgi:hypothetical protein
MYDEWSVANHLTNIKLVLRSALEGRATTLDLTDAYYQIDHIRRKLGLPVDPSDDRLT